MAKAKRTTSPKSDQQQPLGNLIAAVLAHPDTPSDVYNSVVDAVADLGSRSHVLDEAPAIQAILDKAKYQAAVEACEAGDQENKPRRNGVPFTVVNDFLDELQPLNTCLMELSTLNDTGKQPSAPALMALLSGMYETATDRFIERAESAKRPLVEEGGAA